jgi:hypothetical protein
MRIFALAVAVTVVTFIPVLSGCERKASDATPEKAGQAPLPYRPASAAEVFELRSRCAALGQKILEGDLHGPALSVDVSSNYNARTNRCYVELSASRIDDPVHFHHETLYDGQTQEMLAFTEDEGGKKKAAVFARNDNAPYDKNTDWYTRAAEYIGNQMEDDRTN